MKTLMIIAFVLTACLVSAEEIEVYDARQGRIKYFEVQRYGNQTEVYDYQEGKTYEIIDTGAEPEIYGTESGSDDTILFLPESAIKP
jgi:hypothetical protein